MIKLGIIGAENSHSFHIGALCNTKKKVSMRVTHIWGETMEFAKVAASKGAIPQIVRNWEEMEGQVDGIMIDHRDGGLHEPAARYFIERGIPTFIDKPITTDLAQAGELFDLAEKRGTPVCTFGVIPQQKQFRAFARKMEGAGEILALNMSGPVDMDSPYGGIFFYGIHQVESIVELMGTQAIAAQLTRNGRNGVGTIFFPDDRMATLNCLSENGIFHWRACTEKGVYSLLHKSDDDPYLHAARIIHRFIRDGDVPWTRARMLAPIAILQALQKSEKSDRIEAVEKI